MAKALPSVIAELVSHEKKDGKLYEIIRRIVSIIIVLCRLLCIKFFFV